MIGVVVRVLGGLVRVGVVSSRHLTPWSAVVDCPSVKNVLLINAAVVLMRERGEMV